MIKSQRLCRRTLNFYVGRIVAIFAWGVEEELVKETTYRALKLVKPLEKGHPGTWDKMTIVDQFVNALYSPSQKICNILLGGSFLL